MRTITIKFPTLPKFPRVNLSVLRNNTLNGVIKVATAAKAKPPTDSELTAIIDKADLSTAQKLVVLNYLRNEIDSIS
jgi:hypothetical protein